ncbi:MAG TPA: 50S ribosomal protein L5 [Candidatus Sphingobacterium stercoripullorum]|nr:50S ribosomal protein L5 [Candidatus Sphingobacterium stercoripullorum]
MTYIPRLQAKYTEEIRPQLKEKFEFKSIMQVPRLEKIVLSQGVGGGVADKKLVDNAVNEMSMIAGQKAVATISKKDVSNFKLRKGMPVGAKVTLRKKKMYEFLDRLIAISLPRIRDFRGINEKGFDGRGNYNLGITEQIIFPEINIDRINKITGMDITFVTSTDNDIEALELLKAFGLPFKNQKTEK